MQYPKSFQSKKYPDFIRNSIFLKVYDNSSKIFPKIGLKNCSVLASSIKPSKQIYLKKLMQDVGDELGSIYNSIKYSNVKSDNYILSVFISELQTIIWENTDNEINFDLSKSFNILYRPIKKKLSITKNLTLSEYIKIAKDFAIKLKLKSVADRLSKIKFTNNNSNTDFNNAFKNKNIKICFSSNQSKGAWDIATMSMRGIKSCMDWESDNSKTLIGSIIDPYVGVIYLTDDTQTKNGSKMLARAVVRCVVDKGKTKPFIFIEKIYFNSLFKNNEVIRSNIEDKFYSFIENKTKSTVILDLDKNDYIIPYSEETLIIAENEPQYDGSTSSYNYTLEAVYLPYRDSQLEYNKIEKFYKPDNLVKAFKIK